MSFLVLESTDSSGGYNTREQPRDLLKSECQALVNQFPGSPAPQARPGISFWGRGSQGTSQGRTADLVELIPFRRPSGSENIVLQVFTDGVRAVPRVGDSYLVEDGSGTAIPGPRASSIVSWARIEAAVVSYSTDPTWKWIFEEVQGVIVARRPGISRPSFSIVPAESTTTGRMATGWYKYGVTFVNRGESKGSSRVDQYAPGLLESAEDSAARVMFNLSSASAVDLTISWPSSVVLDPQVTHVRLYRTDVALSLDTVDALTLHWVADLALPVLGTSISFTDTVAVAETDFAPETTDLDEVPSAARIYYNDGRLWFVGIQGLPTGNAWFSRIFTTTVLSPLKSLGFLDLTTDFVRIASDSTERAMGIGQANGDLYFMTENVVAYLAGGNPEAGIKTISTSMGCPFFRSVVEFEQILVWLSPVGPVYAQNGYVDKMVQHKAGEVWFYTFNGRGAFHDSTQVDKNEVIGFRYRGAYYLAYKRKVIGFYESADKRVQGAFQVEFSDPDMSLDRVCVLSPDEAVFDKIHRPAWTSGSRVYPWQFLDLNATTDCGYFITLKQTMKRYHVNLKDLSMLGEPYCIDMWANFTDNGQLKLYINGDGFRWSKVFTYTERGFADIQQPQDRDHRTVFVYRQPVPAPGLRASWFDVTWEKVFRPPFDFNAFGVLLKVIPRTGLPTDSISMDLGTDVPVDVGMAVFDPNYNSLGGQP